MAQYDKEFGEQGLKLSDEIGRKKQWNNSVLLMEYRQSDERFGIVKRKQR